MNDITFEHPNYLFGLLILIPIIAWYILRHKNLPATMKISNLSVFAKTPKTYKHYFLSVPFALRIVALALLIIALARPQSTNRWETTSVEGIDIVLALDISSSMLAMDFQPNRLEAAKDVAIQFVTGRSLDRIGLVVFSAESFTQCPITIDHAVLINLFKDIKQGMIEDGTAIGLGLANSVNRLKESKSESKVIILLTDGVNNAGEIAPQTAADIAAAFGIRVYTVGVGTMGFAPYPVQTPFGMQYQNMEVKIDEEVLQEIAKKTDGKYFRATDNKKLIEIYKEIDKLEKSKIEVQKHSHRQERFFPIVLLALGIFLLEFLIKHLLLRTLP